jgi:hypothetical protein
MEKNRRVIVDDVGLILLDEDGNVIGKYGRKEDDLVKGT